MSIGKTIAQRIFKISKISNQYLQNCKISSPAQGRILSNPGKPNLAPDPGNNGGIFRRLFHKRAVAQSTDLWLMRNPETLVEKLRSFDLGRDRIRLDGLTAPIPAPAAEESEGLTVEDARKLLRVAQLEMVKTKLREMESAWISHSELVSICGDCCSDPEQGVGVAKMLDDSGAVIVMGNAVMIKPDQVVKAIGGLIPLPATNPNDPRRKELQEMEEQKAVIDEKADTLVRRELWSGLGFFVVQTAGFMRLTFWELSWDVMEPICFYVTSMYCMAGYTFFLRTSKEPSFEGFYHSRFLAKQKKLMKVNNFDVERYHQLRKVCYPIPSYSSKFSKHPPEISWGGQAETSFQ